MSMTTPGYEVLADVLQAAYDQAAHGKGAERHARGNAFEDQHMQTISTLLGSHDGMAFQAIKKLTEGLAFTNHGQRERELLGVIVYVAGIIVWHREQHGALPTEGYLPEARTSPPPRTSAELLRQAMTPRCIVCGYAPCECTGVGSSTLTTKVCGYCRKPSGECGCVIQDDYVP